jgi:hypothetical protein
MIVGDRKALKATLTHGISDILQEVVDLYSINLNQLGDTIPSIFISGLTFCAAACRRPNHCVGRIGVHRSDGTQLV